MRDALAGSAAALLLLVATPAQSTIVVQGGGMAFAQAVDAANPGDTLLVRPGTYYTTTITKGLRVLCDPNVDYLRNIFGPGFYVRGIPAGEQFTLRGGKISGSVHLGFETGVWNSAGGVTFDGVRFETSENRFEANAALAFRDCTMGTLHLEASTASFADCTIQGGVFQAAMLIVGGDVSMSGGSVTAFGLFQTRAVPAIAVGSGTLHLAGDASTRIAAGSNGPPVPAIELGPNAVLRLHPAVTLVPVNSPPIVGAGTVEMLPLPTVAISGAAVGQVLTADMRAEPGSYSAVFLSWAVPPVALAPFGTLWIAGEAPLMFGGTVPASGALSATTGVPGVVADATIVAQALSITTGRRLLVGTPTVFVVR